MDKISINELRVQAIIGVNTGERVKKQNLTITVDIFCDASICGRTDRITDTIDYSTITKDIIDYAETSKHYTIEALSTGIAKICCMKYGVNEVLVRVEKPNALTLARAPSVEIRRTKQFFIAEQAMLAKLSENEHSVYVAIGSNVGNRLSNIQEALNSLQIFSKVEQTAFLYETPPAYVTDQPAFLNTACKISTKLSPEQLLTELKGIENKMGREKTIRFGPRNIDLDIIFYDNIVFTSTSPIDLSIPHPRVQERDFVLGPLLDIAEDYVHPSLKKTVRELFEQLSSVALSKVIPIGGKLFNIASKTLLMGIINVTPDSFSDGGEYNSIEKALKRAQEMVAAGVDIIDIGGQSTRPGAVRISEEEEISRVIPTIKAIRQSGITVILSIDTFYSKVAKEAVLAGVDIINDITGGNFDENMLKVASELKIPICLMHMKGNPETMQQFAQYENVVKEVKESLKEKANAALSQGIFRWNIILDPGIGFAKKKEHNIELLKKAKQIVELGYVVLYGTSRKKFIGEITNKSNPADRAFGTAATLTAAIQQGVHILRVHDVEKLIDTILVSDQIYKS